MERLNGPTSLSSLLLGPRGHQAAPTPCRARTGWVSPSFCKATAPGVASSRTREGTRGFLGIETSANHIALTPAWIYMERHKSQPRTATQAVSQRHGVSNWFCHF